MTPRQKQVLDFIRSYVESHSYAPSYAEIGVAIKVTSSATVHKHVRNLEKKRLLTHDYNGARSIKVLNVCPTCGRKVTRRGDTERRLDAMQRLHQGAMNAAAEGLI